MARFPQPGRRARRPRGRSSDRQPALARAPGASGPSHHETEPLMPYVTAADGTEIFYKDWGEGQPIVFHHGWPLTGDDWDAKMMFFLQRGFRVIAHDRRG